MQRLHLSTFLFVSTVLPLFVVSSEATYMPRPARRAILQSSSRTNPTLLQIAPGLQQVDVLGRKFDLDLIEDSDLVYGPAKFYTGVVVGVSNSEVQLLVSEDGVSGTIRVQGMIYELLTDGRGRTQETKMDPSKFRGGDEVIAPNAPEEEALMVIESSHRQVVELVTLDWCVFYTDASQQDAGGEFGIRNKILAIEGDANTAYKNSLLETRARVVYTERVAFDEDSSDWGKTLSLFAGRTDGVMDSVHDAREQYGCDLMILLIAPTNDGSTAGIGYVGSSWGTAFSVSETRYASSGVTAHEVGHNAGCGHDVDNGGGGISPWSKGYTSLNDKISTVMAYNCVGCTPLSVFSSGSKFDLMTVGDPEVADCARTIRERAATLASFMPNKADAMGLPSTPSPTPASADGGKAQCRDRGRPKAGGARAILRVTNGKAVDVSALVVDFSGSEKMVGVIPGGGAVATIGTTIGNRIRLRHTNATKCIRSLVISSTYRHLTLGM